MTLAEKASALTQEEIIALLKREEEQARTIVSLRKRDDEQSQKIVALRKQEEQQSEKIAELKRQVAWFQRQMFGQKSERRLLALGDARQLSLGELLEFSADLPEPSETVHQYQRRLTKRPLEETPEDSGLRFDSTVPVKEIQVADPALEGLQEGTDYEVIEIKSTYRLAQEPGSYVVLKYNRKVTKLRENGKLLCPPAPDSPLPKSFADVSVLAGLLIDKFLYHLPLYRLHQRLKDSGVVLSRMTLTNFVHRATELLSPIYYAQLSSVLQSRVLAMDETPIRAGPSPGGGKMHQGYFWPLYGDQNEVCFPYSPSRSHGVVGEILGEFCGVLVSDGYDAYARYAECRDRVIQALCWSHTRRNFVEAEVEESALANEALRRIKRLYDLEEQIRKNRLKGEKKQSFRAQHSLPEVDQFFLWLKAQLAERLLLPSNSFTKAAVYALAREKGLRVFLENPDVPIDTNHLERVLRPIPMGRKNWLFCSTELGAELVGKIQSLIQTCRLQEVDPYTYLIDVLQRIDIHPVREVHLLTPRLWKQNFANQPLRSDLHPVKHVVN